MHIVTTLHPLSVWHYKTVRYSAHLLSNHQPLFVKASLKCVEIKEKGAFQRMQTSCTSDEEGRYVTMGLSAWWVAHKTLKWYLLGKSFLFEMVWWCTVETTPLRSTYKTKQNSPSSVFSPYSEVSALAQWQSSSPEASIQWLQQGKCLLTWGHDLMSQLRPRGSLPLSLLAAQMTWRVPVYYHSVLIGMFKPPQIKTMIYVCLDFSKTALRKSHVTLAELQHCNTLCARIQMQYSYACCVYQCLLI